MAGGTGGNYRIVLQALIDEKSVKTQLEQIAKNATLQLQVTLNPTNAANQINKAIGNIQSKINPIKIPIGDEDSRNAVSQINARMQAIRAAANKNESVSYKYGVSRDPITGQESQQVLRATISYTDDLGRSRKEVYRWVVEENAAHQQTIRWVKQEADYTENVGKARRKATQEAERQAKAEQTEMDRAEKYAKKFLERSKSMDGNNKLVQAGQGQANDLLSAVKDKNIANVRTFNQALQETDGRIREAGKSTGSFSEQLGNVMKRTIEYAITVGALYGVLDQLKQGVQYVRDLNKAMTDIQVVTGYTDETINSLASDFNSMAREMGGTTLEIAQGTTEWFRQGKTIQETETLMRSSMMMSKLAAMDSAEATEYLTSIMNGFQMKATDATSAVDKLVN